jgi:transglutaminase-like putative cysteine protease
LKKLSVLLLFISVFQSTFSQEFSYQSLIIDEKFTNDANSCIRDVFTSIQIESNQNMLIEHKKVITIFNKFGDKDIDAYLHYDKNVSVKELEATIYDKLGKEIKKIKKRDFRDVSAVDGGTLYSDSRVYYLDYTPLDYPYTVEFIYKTENENTAFIQPWQPVKNYHQSVMNNKFVISDDTGLNLRHVEKNLDYYFSNIQAVKKDNKIMYDAKNIEPLDRESYSPSLKSFLPIVHFALSNFRLEGVDGKAENWNELGKWQFEELIKGRDKVSEKTRSEILALTQGIDDPIEKIKLVYQYMQSKTRYISVQVGIGGWQPIDAETVDQVKYGDCKGLTNYTKALLNIAGIDSKYTVVYAGAEKINIDENFASMQGNHVILNVPMEDKDIWLECTSQSIPFGFLGDFTDDRDVLVIDENGGKIKHTDAYYSKDNYQNLSGQIEITPEGHLNADYVINSKGIQFDNKYYLDKKSNNEVIKYYKRYYSHLNNLEINSFEFSKNTEKIEFEEKLSLTSKKYCKKFGNRFMLMVNALNQSIAIPNKYEDRQTPFVVNRGFFDEDHLVFKLPAGLKVESQPKDINIDTKFGKYQA